MREFRMKRNITRRYIENHWICGLFHRREFQIIRKSNVSDTRPVSVFRSGEGTSVLLSPLESANLSHWIEFPKRRVLKDGLLDK
jgi:hypothetical protein